MAEKKEKQFVSDNAQLMAEWNWDKNNESGFNPEKFTCGSNKNLWWKCDQGHEWMASVYNRNNGTGCPYCSNRKVLSGFNDLLTISPSLAKEWNYDKNGILKPNDFVANSGKKVWWKCSNGHEWIASISQRNNGTNCPYCAGKYVTKGENDLQTLNPDLAKEWNYNKNNGLTPSDIFPNSNIKVWWKCGVGHEWSASPNNRNNGRGCPYCANKKVLLGYNDLQTVNPSLSSEWNYDKNKGLTPNEVMPNSNKKVWWVCTKGHEWSAIIESRNKGSGCPICNSEQNTSFPEYALVYYLKKHGLKVIHSYKEKGYELDVYLPSLKIAIEYDGSYWHKNKTEKDLAKNRKCIADGIILYRIREGLAPLNDSSIDYIVQKNQINLTEILQNCLCEIIGTNIDIDLERDATEIANLREFTEKENSLLLFNSQIANEWNFKRNGKLKPENFSANSSKKVWWSCSEGHEWQAVIYDRNQGKGCPYCSNKKILKGYNDMQTTNPLLASEWNFEKNKSLTPWNVVATSGKKVWWKCIKGHEWNARIDHRSNGVGCPYCAGRQAVSGENDLQTVNPTLASEWNFEKNEGFIPNDILPNSDKKVWWRCSKGHEWQAIVGSRNKGSGCPYCSSRKVLIGFNDLQTINPYLSKEWNYDKNKGLTPMDFLPNSNHKVWWKCSKDHEWQARINARNHGNGCPECAKERRKKKSVSGDSEKT